ncbi:hypothetical protein QJQ45_013486 [Haematococcus lacustris]|nr:hypothetical protein QJQ45_013486 [Haematococcus lacustris]
MCTCQLMCCKVVWRLVRKGHLRHPMLMLIENPSNQELLAKLQELGINNMWRTRCSWRSACTSTSPTQARVWDKKFGQLVEDQLARWKGQLKKEMAELSMKRQYRAKQLWVFFGAADTGTGGGWGADVVLRACCKVVCWLRAKTSDGAGWCLWMSTAPTGSAQQ